VSLGSAEAAARLAVIAAAGIGGTPDWPAALRLLALAAERGWGDAEEQLVVLASVLRPDASKANSRAILESADPRQLLAPPAAGTLIHNDPRIGVFPNFLNEQICARLIARSRNKLERARVYDAFTHKDFVDESRTNSSAMFTLMDTDIVQVLVQARMALAVGLPVSHMEAPTVLHYAVGETIGNHYDFVDPAHAAYDDEIRKFGNRSITFLVYLNVGDYTSGETVFPHLGLSHSGRFGEGLFFVNTHGDGRPNLRTLHNGRPPTSGEKWIVSQFIRDRPWS
jgi:prolyl 4-hydroxylase